MSEWSELPEELIDLIAKHIGSEIDVIRFRSVCSSWRSSSSFKRPTPTDLSQFPIRPNDVISTAAWGFYLSKRTIFRLGLPEQPLPQAFPSDGWLIKIDQDAPLRCHLLNPLSRFVFRPLPRDFPRTIDLMRYRVSELGQEYTLQYRNYRPFASSIGQAGSLYMEKVALRPTSSIEDHLLLTIHVSGKLAMFRFGENKWSIIDDITSPYDDVILFQGKFYAVDYTGRTVIVDVDSLPSPSLNLAANPVFGGDRKVLVESCNDLLLVDTFLSVGHDDESDVDGFVEFYEEVDCCLCERTVRFKVYKLDQREQNWVEVRNLGDRLLFLGDNSTFSASASDFTVCKDKGNCIIFSNHYFYSSREDDDAIRGEGIGVFDLESGSIESLTNYPGFSKLFWPPPEWITLTKLEDGIKLLDI